MPRTLLELVGQTGIRVTLWLQRTTAAAEATQSSHHCSGGLGGVESHDLGRARRRFGAVAAGPPIVALAKPIRANAVLAALILTLVLARAVQAGILRGAKASKRRVVGCSGNNFRQNGGLLLLWSRGSLFEFSSGCGLVGGGGVIWFITGNRKDVLVVFFSLENLGRGEIISFQRLVLVDAEAVPGALAAGAFAHRARVTLAAVTSEPCVTAAFPRVAHPVPAAVHDTQLEMLAHDTCVIGLTLAAGRGLRQPFAVARAGVALLDQRGEGFALGDRTSVRGAFALARAADEPFAAEAATAHTISVHAVAVDLATMLVASGPAPTAGATALVVAADAIWAAILAAILGQGAVHAAEPAFAFATRTAAPRVNTARINDASAVAGSDLDVAVCSSPAIVAFALPDLEPRLVRVRGGHEGDEACRVGTAIAAKVAASSL